MKNILRIGLIAMVLAVLGACSSTKLPPPSNVTSDQGGANMNGGADANAVKMVDTTGGTLSENAKRSIYFDFDSFVVKDEYRPIIEENARFLTKNKNRRIVIQGNTDERGGSEYNLALGQKRAEAVRRALALLGVSDSQMEAVSFGKEKPKALGHDEASWAENRRDDIVYQ
ncbi:MAG: peptidoglycan-associated lipoprotein Pal [Burkholderiaceae bacterium]|jgi:peptidoglycan-associated lipoprotein